MSERTGKLPMLYDRRMQAAMQLVMDFPTPRRGFSKDEHVCQMVIMLCDEMMINAIALVTAKAATAQVELAAQQIRIACGLEPL